MGSPSVLLVGFTSSIHLVRYAALLDQAGWDVHVVDVAPSPAVHPEWGPCTMHLPMPSSRPVPEAVTVAERPEGSEHGHRGQALALRHALAEVRPDVVHAHETSQAGLAVDRARQELGGDLGAPWIVTNWGSDLFWFGRDPRWARRLRSAMTACPYLVAECHRDIALARAFGFRGEVLGVWPVAGGFDLEHCERLRTPGPTSARRAIAVKGVTDDYGCGLQALEALERCGDLLDGMELCGYQMSEAATGRATALAEATGMRYTQLSDTRAASSTHDDLLRMHGRARVSLGLNRSDALSTSFLEAVAMGSFPVQARTSCGYELTPDGRGALFVDPEDVDAVAIALRRALTGDELVDQGAALNARVAREGLDRRRIRARVLDAYEHVLLRTAVVGL